MLRAMYIAVLLFELELAFIGNYEIRYRVAQRALQGLCFKYAFPFHVGVRWIGRDGPQYWPPRSPDLKSIPPPNFICDWTWKIHFSVAFWMLKLV